MCVWCVCVCMCTVVGVCAWMRVRKGKNACKFVSLCVHARVTVLKGVSLSGATCCNIILICNICAQSCCMHIYSFSQSPLKHLVEKNVLTTFNCCTQELLLWQPCCPTTKPSSACTWWARITWMRAPFGEPCRRLQSEQTCLSAEPME